MAAGKNRESKVIYLWPEQLEVAKGFNVRFEMGDITGLSKSIVANGIKDPLRGYKTNKKTPDEYPIYVITNGHRRFEAAKRIADKMEDGDFIPFVVEPTDYDPEQRVIDMLTMGENNQPLNLLESARGVKRLLDGGMGASDIARKIGKSPTHITDCKILMEKASEQQIKDVENRTYTASFLVELLKANTTEKVDTILEKGKEAAAAKGKTKLKKSELEEASGEAITQKGKKSQAAKESSVKTAGSDKKKDEEKVDATTTKLIDLRTALKAQQEVKNEPAFALLNAIINLCKGKVMPIDLIPLFFIMDEDEEAALEAEVEAPKKGKTAKKAAAPKGKTKKKKPAKQEDEDEDAELEDVEDLDNDEDEELE